MHVRIVICGRERNSRGIPRLWIATASRGPTPQCPRVLQTSIYAILAHCDTTFTLVSRLWIFVKSYCHRRTRCSLLFSGELRISHLNREHVEKTIDNSYLSRVWSFLTTLRDKMYRLGDQNINKIFLNFILSLENTIEDKYCVFLLYLHKCFHHIFFF